MEGLDTGLDFSAELIFLFSCYKTNKNLITAILGMMQTSYILIPRKETKMLLGVLSA